MYLVYEYNFYSYLIIIFEEHLLQKKNIAIVTNVFILENGLFRYLFTLKSKSDIWLMK